jgi:hypothetical protein
MNSLPPLHHLRSGASVLYATRNNNPSSLLGQPKHDVIVKKVALNQTEQTVLNRFEQELQHQGYLNSTDELSLVVNSVPASDRGNGLRHSVHTYLNHLDHSSKRRVCSPVGFSQKPLDMPSIKRAAGFYCKSLDGLINAKAL